MTISVPGHLEIDTHRGVIYFHAAMGHTVLRICRLPALELRGYDPERGMIDITHMHGVSIPAKRP